MPVAAHAAPRHLPALHLSLPVKLAASLAAVGTAAAVSGLGTFGVFTSTTSASTAAASGSVTIALGAVGPANRLNVGATGMVPGDTMKRAFTLSNTGSQALGSLSLTTTASPSSLLDTDATNGLQLLLQSCSTPWTEAGISPAFTYTCGGTTTTVLASRPVIGSGVALSSPASLPAGGSDNLLMTLTFPTTAGDTLQNQSSTLSLAFTGTQRSATNK